MTKRKEKKKLKKLYIYNLGGKGVERNFLASFYLKKL
jgi:hypothetical protein